ncbi:MAG TPA: lysophospholipase [Candidatus Limnocylindrales bacterium]|nr:lysophospholipase [Candidatus Limnocylindrales bacterium]
MTATTARTRDGLTLRGTLWPAVGDMRGHLLLVHGIAEHASRHAHVAERFAREGIATHAFDLRGFGASEGSRAYVDSWSQYHDDVEDQLKSVRSEAAGAPVVLYGHSMGGLIALGYVLAAPPRPSPDVLVLSAPAIGATIPQWKRRIAAVLARVMPRFRIANALPPGGLSRDPSIEAAYRSDALNTHSTTARLGAELLREQTRITGVLARLDAMPLPTYVLHGSADPIVPVRSTEALAGKRNVTRRVYPELRHETHNEPEGGRVIDDTVTWLLGALRSLSQPSR